MKDLEKENLKKLDLCFPYFHEYGEFDIDLVIPEDIVFNEGEVVLRHTGGIVSEFLIQYGYADINVIDRGYMNPDYKASLTDIGREAKIAGGHFAYLEKKEKERKEKEGLAKYDFLQKKFIYKYRGLPFIFSALALVISAWALLNDISCKGQKEKTEVLTEKTDTLKQNSKSTTLLPADSLLKTDSTKKR